MTRWDLHGRPAGLRSSLLVGALLGRHKQAAPPQCQTQNSRQRQEQAAITSAEEQSRTEILAAIQGSRVALEGKIETVALEVNLLWPDLRKVSDKVAAAEGSIVELQTEVATRRKQLNRNTTGRYDGSSSPGSKTGLGWTDAALDLEAEPGQGAS
ncbi:hypothetical protein NDU88_003936 [Pleurodeles waltl]|uniref:Uncharacterized protein n=1 Tax=Pleurodeles waltl TaxID=8319 RepID=A0AAV7N1K2_PLEWA|nr:hypothetical protein NDU88_003936 [Pleurodeles waltl]